MTLRLRVALIAYLSATNCLAQTGTVTFYSLGISAKSEAAVFIPKSQQPFTGWLSDGPERLAHFKHGRFATFHLNTGPHPFAVVGPTGPGKAPLVLDIKDGSQYCVRLFARMINLGVYASWENKIEEVPCQLAEREAAHLKSLDSKHVEPAASNELDPRTTFPSGSQSQN